MATKSIGYVVELVGGAQVRSVEGVIRVLSIGDQIHEGDILTTGLNTQIVLEFFDGHKLQVGENTEMLLDESVFAGLNAYPEERADQLAELQSLIVEGIDLAELEATAAGAANDSDALHQASIYSREGNEGVVETRVTPFNLGASGLDDQSLLDDNLVQIPDDSSADSPALNQGPASMLPPTASITVDNITADDVINAVDASAPIAVTGTVSGDAMPGDTVSFTVNSTPYSGPVNAGNTFSILVAAADLVTDNSFTATVSGIDGTGNPYSATTTSTHTVDTTATATITLDPNITPDDRIDAVEALGTVAITGTVTGDFQAGDIVTLTVNGVNTTGSVLADGSFSIDVNGSDLRNDPDSTIDASFVATDAAGNIAAPVTDTESYTVNTAPDAVDDVSALDIAEDGTTAILNATMLANDSDLDGDAIGITEINGTVLTGGVQSIVVTNGTVNIDAGDNITFTPDANYNGPVSFDYTLSDGSLTDIATVSGTISAINDQPVASDVAINAAEDGATVNGNFTVTDADTTDTHTFAITSAPAEGSVVNNGNGTFTFDPGADFQDLADGETRDVTFTYTATDDSGAANDTSVSQTVTVTVTGTNDQPVAGNVAIAAVEDGPTVNGNFTVTDADTTDTHTFAITSAPAEGSVVNNGNGTFTFDPGADFQDLADGETRDVTFTYTATDDSGAANDTSVSQTVTVTVTGTNDQPVAGNVAIAAVEDGPTVNGNFTVTDADTTDTHTFAITSAPAEGSVVNNGNGTFTFDPGADFQDLADGETRDVTFTYTATDDSGTANATSVAQTVTVTVTGTNDQPVAGNVAIAAIEDGPTVNGNFTVTDADTTDTHTFAITSAPAEGSVVNNGNGTFTFDPGADFQDLADGETRDVTFTYTATDDSGAANDTSVAQTVTVTVTGTNDQPVAGNVAIAAIEDGATVNGNFTVTDADTTDTHTFAITGLPSEGSVVNNGNGTFTFDPGADFQDLADGETRDVTFTYTATDDSGTANATSVAQTVTVTVTGTNDQPVAGNVAIAAVEDGATVNGNFTVTDADTTDTHTFAITSAPAEGSVVNNGNGTFTFDPGADFQDLADGETRDVTFTYTATDDSGAANDTSVSQTVTVTVTGTNDQPVAGNVAIAAVEDGPTVNGNFTVTDADTTDTHTFAITSAPAEGSVVNNGDGTFTFDPGADFQDLADGETRDVTFTYTATDDSGAANATSIAQTVTVTVTGTNDQPVASDVAIAAIEDGATVNGNFTVTDADTTDTHTFAITSAPAEGSVVNNGNGTFTFDPGADFQDLADGETRDVTFTYTATDDSGTANATSVAQTVTVTVTGTNDQPVASDVAIAALEDGATVNGNFTVTDADTTDTHTFAITSAPAEGSVVNNGNGTFTFDPGADFQDLADGETRDVTFTYTATDDSGTANATSVAQTVTVTVTGTNDQPVAGNVAIAAIEDGPTVNGNFTVTDADTTDTHTFAITGLPSEGSVVNNGNGTFTFDPGADFQDLADGETRDVTFTYTATDDSGAANATSVAQTVTVTVTGTNDQPVAGNVAIAAIEDGSTVNGNFTVTDADTTDTHTFAITSAPAEGSVVNNGNGTFTFDPGADFQDLADGETRDVTFTYTATDDSGAANAASVAQTVTVTVTGTNDQPVAGNVAIAAIEDGPTVNGNFTVTDADTTDTHTFAITSAPAEGSVVNNGNGTFTFDPGADFQDLADGETRDVTFTYTATDDSGTANATSVAQTVTVTVTGTNDQPVAGNVAIAAIEDGATVNGNFTVTDADTTDTHTFAITSAPAEGSVVNNGNGTFTFDPGADFQDLADGETRDVTFTYTATDDSGAANDTSVAQTVTVTVTGTNDQPVATDSTHAIAEDSINVALNLPLPTDIDVTDVLTVTITGLPDGLLGTATLANGSALAVNQILTLTEFQGLEFDAVLNATGTSTLTYEVNDGSGTANATDNAVATITVGSSNDVPVAVENSYAVSEDVIFSGNVITDDTGSGIDSDADGDPLSVSAVDGVPANVGAPVALLSGATLTMQTNGDFDYDPSTSASFNALAEGETAIETFNYTITDANGGFDVATVTLTVTGTNDQPVASDVAINAVEDGATVNGNFTVTDADTTDTHTFAITSAPAEGSVVNNGNGTFTFDPGADFQDLADGETRDVTFTYTATDDSGAANDTSVAQTVTVTVTGTNDQPVAGNVAIAAIEDGATVNGNFTVTDADTTDAHTFTITSSPSEGSVVNNGNGTFTFDPGADFQDLADGETRDVTFTYTATDDSGAANDTSIAQTVTVTVTGTNDQPVASDVAINAVEDGATVNGNFTVTDADTTDTHTFAITSAPAEGSVVNNGNGTFTFDPGSDFQDLADGETRDVTFTYTATDDSGAANATSIAQTVTVTVTGTNDQPVAGNVAIAAIEDGSTVNGNFTVTDADTTDTHTFAITSAPAEGSVVNNGNGTFTFDPGADFQDLADGETRDVTFTYTATDDSGTANATSVAQTVTVTVTGTNDQPVAGNVAIAAIEDGPTVNGNFTVTDADTTDTHTFAITSAPAEGSVVNNGNGTFTFDPGADFQDLADGETRDVTFTYTATDDSGAANATSVAQTVTVTVTGTNDQPVAGNVAIAAIEDGSTVNGNFTVTDADTTDTHTFAITSAPAEGSVVNNGNGTFTFDPGADFQDLADGETRDVTFTYTATDDSGTANATSVAQTVTVTVTGTNDQPVAGNVAIAAIEDGPTVNGNFTVTDADTTDTHTFAITSAPAEGSVVNNGNGTFTFDPGADFQDLADGETRDVTFTYTATDDSGAANDTSVAQTVTVTVTGTNDQPVASDVAIAAVEDGATVNGNFTVTDADTTDTHTFAITSAPAEGSVVNNGNGTFTFDPGADFQDLADGETRDVTFTYTATDDSGTANAASVAQTVTVTVTGTNDQPVAGNVAIAAVEDGPTVNGNFTVTDADTTDTHTFAITSSPSEGSVVNNGNGTFTFDPGADFQDLADGETRDVTFTYTTTDDSGAANDTSVSQTVTVTVTGTNDQPVAGNVAIAAVEDGPTVNGNFTVTDADTTDTHTFAITSAPAEGSVVNNGNGTFTFDPGADFQDLADGETRDVTFTYTATDDSGAANDTSVAQTVTVTVTGTNDQPVAGNVAIAAVEDGPTVNGNFTVTDADTTDTHTFAITSAPAEGSVVNNGNGTFTFEPGADFQDLADGETRDVTFTYTATDDSGTANATSVAQTVTVTVTGTNDQPVAGNVAIAAIEDGPTVNGNFTVTDADTTDTHTFAITSAPAEGSVVNNGNGTFTFEPGADFQDLADGETRDVTFTYTATDDSGTANATSVAQTVTVTVTGTNDQPVAGNVAIAAIEDGPTVNGNFTVTDADTTDTHTFAITSAPAEGSVVNNGDGTFTFDPGADFQDLADGETRDVTFTYTATDDSGAANDTSVAQTVTVTVTGTNDQPVASDVAIAAVEDGATVNGNFTVTDADTTDTHTFAITSAPAEGSVVNNGNGTFTFDPGADFQDLADGETRDVTFTYTATDDSGTANATSVAQTVTVTVTGTNDQPVAGNVAIAAVEDGATVNGNFTVTDADTTDTHTFAITSAPAEGSVVNNGNGTFTFDPGADFQDLADGETRDVTFTYTATDDSGTANATSVAQTVTVTVTGTNDQPVAGNVAIAAIEDGPTVNGNFTVTDADTTDTHTFAITSAPAEGSVVNNGDGTFTFDPGADFQDLADGETRDVTFTYTATDDSGAANDTSVAQTVTVTVTGTNDQPVAGNVAIAAVEDGPTVNGNFTVTDADTTDTHTFAITSAPAEGSVVNNGNGTFTFEPGADFQDLADGETRDVTFTYTATDDSGTANATSVAQTVTVTVTGTNDQPVAGNVAIAAIEDGPTVNGNFTVTDADTTDTHTFAITSAPAEGSVVNNGDGTFTFDPGADFQDLADGETRDVTFTYTATDDSGAANDTSVAQTVTVTVTGTNDQPVASDVAIAAVEDGATVNGNFTVTDADTTDTHTFAITSAPAEGSVVNNGNGTFTFDPGADFQDLADGETRDVTFTYTATDDSGTANATSVAQTVTVTVTGTNDQPVAGNVAIAAVEDGATVNGNFTVTDADTTDTHTFAITSAPAEGSVVNNGNGTFTFDPGADFQDLADGETRDVTFTYTATDDSGTANATSVAQTVTVTVTGTNDQPVAGNVAIAAIEDGPTVNGNFTVTDADTTDTHTFAITSAPAEGSVVNNGDGTFTFDPGADFQDLADGETRDVTFTYTATDDSGTANATSVAQTVTVTVTGTNDQPVAGNVAIAAIEDGPTVNGNFTVTDADTTDTHTFAITSAPAEGSVVNNGNGTFTFEPGADFQDLADGETRDVTFTYTATDDSGTANATSVAQTVTVTVTGTNDQPVAGNVAIAAIEDGPTVNGNFTVTDADTTDTHTFAITGLPSEGSVVNNGNGTFTFDPGADFQDLADGETRDVTFTYTATDDSGTANATSVAQTVTVTVTGTNDQPVAGNVAIAAVEDGATVNGNFTVTDADTTDTHTFAITSAPAEGSVVNNGNGTFTFDPGADFQDLADGETRDVTFTYTATDDSGTANATSVAQTVTVTVTGTNDQPVAGNVAIAAVEDGATVNGNFTVTDADTTDTHTFAITSSPSEGSVVNNGNGTFTFDPGADFQDLADGETRDVTFTYTATDDSGAANATSVAQTVTVTVTGTNDQPVAGNVAIAAIEDGSTVNGNFTVTDADTTDTHTFAITSAPAEGSVVNNGNGTFTFDPGADFQDLADGETRDVTFTYTATDDSGTANATSVAQTVTVTVTGTNDQPVAGNVAIAAVEDGATVNGNFTVTDADTTDTHTFAITSAPAEGSVVNNGNGTFTFDPGADFQDLADGETRDVTFTYTATDDSGAANDTSVAQTVTVTVTGTNDGPVIDLDSDNSAAAGNDYAVTFTEGGSAAYIADIDIDITDVDDTSLTSATITVNSVESGDLLTVGSIPAGITASAYNPATGTITLSGSASLADYQTAIQAIQFSNDGSTTNTTRSIDVVVNDGLNNSNTATTDVTIVTLPTVSITDVSVQEPASGTTALTFTISIDQTLGSDLTFDYQTADISALAGSDFVSISSTVGTITAGSTSTTVTVTVNSDADMFEGDETLSLDLTNFNQTVNFNVAAHTISGGVQGIGTIGANNGAPDAVDDSYITTVDTPLIITNALANDTLVDNAVVDVTGYTDLGSGVYSFNGNNGTVVYDSNTGDFTFTPSSGYTGTADFSYTLIDDDGETDTATVSVDVSSVVVNPPVVTNVPDTVYTENDSPVSLVSGVNITDVDSTNLSSVVVTVDGYIGSQDVIAYLTAGTSVVANVVVSGSSWELTLTGGADINEYETVLDSITYENSSDNPSSAVRNITIEAFDQSYANLFGSDAGTITVTPVNDAPDVFDSNIFVLDGSNDNALNITVPTDPDTDDNLLVITITGLPASVGTVTLADGTPVSVGNTLTLAELAGLEFDAGATPGQGTLTYDVFDGSLTTSATTTVNVGSTEADIGTVYESALSNGTGVGGGSDTVTGNLFANDAASTPTSTIDDVNGTTPTGGLITINTAIGTLTVYADNTTPGFSAGDYVYVLNSADGSSNDVDEVFTYTFTEGVALSDTLTVSIIDDAPVANNLVQSIPESEEQIFNLVLTLDISTSMNALVGTTGQTRFELAKAALDALGQEYFNQSTQVQITVVLFADGAHNLGTFDNYTDFATNLAAVQDAGTGNYSNDLLVVNGGPGDPDGDTNATINDGTSYVDPTAMIEHVLTQDIAGQLPADDVQNISYFLSDGAITRDTTTSLIGNGYDTFVNSNSVDSYAVGIGTGLPGDLSDLNYIHNIDALGQGSGQVDDALIVTDVAQLQSELLSTVPTAFGGNITANGSISNVIFGADGGYVESFTTDIGGTDYTFSFDGTTVTVPPPLVPTVVVNGSIVELGADDGFAYGTFTFDFSDGSYTLSAPNGLAPATFDFDYSIIDGDGDIASATATINIVDDAPDARDDLHSLNAFENAEGNVITALGTDGGPSFGVNFTPFTSQGGGVDKIVDDAVLSEFTYKGSLIDLNLTTSLGAPPSGSSESVSVTSQGAIDGSQFNVTGSAALTFDADGIGVAGGANVNLNTGELLTVDFLGKGFLDYGVDNLVLTISDYQSSNTDTVTITVYDTVGATLGTIVQTATNGANETVDLSAFSGVGSIDIAETGGGTDIQVQNISYDPAPATEVLDQTGGNNGSNLSWIYSYETDLDGNPVYQATVTDSNDGSVFIMSSNGYYNYTPDSSGLSLTPEAVATTSGANVTASDLTLSGFDNVGNPTTLNYSGNGVTVQGGWSNDRIDLGEMVTIDFTSKGGNPFGVQNVQFNLTSASANETVTYIIYGLDGTTVLGTENSSADPFTISSTDYPQIGKIDFIADAATYVRIQNIAYDQLDSALPTELGPVLVDYVLTDTDGQSDTAQLALYTIDQTITGTSGIDNIAGGSLNDAIIGDDGDDILAGNAGHDSLSGGAGDDTLSGGAGNDYLSGGEGQDSLSGGAGSDTLAGGAGDDVVDGSSGDDVVLGGDGDDLVFGGSGDDRLEGGVGNDVLTGGSGNDVIFGDAGDDRINGGSGDDSLVGGDGIDIFALESGDEGTVGVPAVDTIADFTVGVGGDVLDLSDMLQGEDLGSLDGFLNFNYNGVTGDTTISIDVDGDSGTFETSQEIVFSGVDLTANGTLTDQQILDNLLSNGNLIVDQ